MTEQFETAGRADNRTAFFPPTPSQRPSNCSWDGSGSYRDLLRLECTCQQRACRYGKVGKAGVTRQYTASPRADRFDSLHDTYLPNISSQPAFFFFLRGRVCLEPVSLVYRRPLTSSLLPKLSPGQVVIFSSLYLGWVGSLEQTTDGEVLQA